MRSLLLAIVVPGVCLAQTVPEVPPVDSTICPSCREWNAPRAPSKLFGNVYYVGTQGLSSILITSAEGHVLIDGGLPESASRIAGSIQSLGFRLADVKLIVHSHAHYDHVGGIGALQAASGARALVGLASATIIATGEPLHLDPQFGLGIRIQPAKRFMIVADSEVVRVGPIALMAHATEGHMPGGTSWTWRSCEGNDCLDFVYGDSQTAVSNDSYRFSKDSDALAAFEKGFRFLETTPCDVLLTPHPGASSMFDRMVRGRSGLVDRTACRSYAERSRRGLADRLAREKRSGG